MGGSERQGFDSRACAVHALTGVFRRREKPKDALETLFQGIRDRRDRALVSELVYGVLRYRDYLDWELRHYLREPERLPPDTVNNLRTALYQIRFMRTPHWAAVHEAVAGEKRRHGKASLVNAVLRNILRHAGEVPAPSRDDSVQYLSVVTSHPRWLVERWTVRFGLAEAEQALRANNERAPLALRCWNGHERKAALHALQQGGVHARATGFSPVGILIDDPLTYHELSRHMPTPFVIQDEAAQLVPYLLDPQPRERILDGCAAPGGKSTHIAQLMGDSGEVYAVESDSRRTLQIEENISRLGLRSVQVVHGDVRALPGAGIFDRILIDAPCSALGIVRRNPDVKYRHASDDILRFQSGQISILSSVSARLKPGGDLVYSVCSTEPEEGEEVVLSFLQSHPDFSIIGGDFDFLKPFETTAGDGLCVYRTYPHRHGMDGFFFARMRKSL